MVILRQRVEEATIVARPHFGLEKGTVSNEKKKELITARLSQLRRDMLRSFRFMLAKMEVLFDFMDLGI